MGGALTTPIQAELKKPLDGSDVTTLEEAKAEIVRLRGLLSNIAEAHAAQSTADGSHASTNTNDEQDPTPKAPEKDGSDKPAGPE